MTKEFGGGAIGSMQFATKATLDRHIDYVHFNPVKHKLVPRVCDWPHSSFHRYVERGQLARDWGGDLGDLPGTFGE